jgi:hypothetical protein
MKNKFLKYSLISLLVLIGIAGSYFSIAQLNNDKGSYDFIDKDNKFSFRYPSNFVVLQQAHDFIQLGKNDTKDIEGDHSSIMVRVRNNPENIALQDWFQKNPKYYVGNRTFNDVKNSGIQQMEISGKEVSTITYEGMGELKTAVLKLNDNQTLEITAHSLGSFEKDTDLLNAYDFILENINQNEN